MEAEYSEEKINSFNEAAKPLIKWLCENCDPHASVVVDPTSAVLMASEICFNTEDYLKD